MPIARQQAIMELARHVGRVTVDGLAAHFEVTPQTIRRDLTVLRLETRLQRLAQSEERLQRATYDDGCAGRQRGVAGGSGDSLTHCRRGR